jgi:hypothetical protein
VAGAAGHGSTRAVAGNRAVDERWIEIRQGGVTELHALHHSGTETLNQDVCLQNALSERVAAAVGAQVEREQLLAAVERIEIGIAGRERTDGVAGG